MLQANITREMDELMWDEESGMHYDLFLNGSRTPFKTVAALYPLLAAVGTDRFQILARLGCVSHRRRCGAGDEPHADRAHRGDAQVARLLDGGARADRRRLDAGLLHGPRPRPGACSASPSRAPDISLR